MINGFALMVACGRPKDRVLSHMKVLLGQVVLEEGNWIDVPVEAVCL